MNQMVAEMAVVSAVVPEMMLGVPTHPISILVDRRPGRMDWVALPFEHEDLNFPEWDDPRDVEDFWADLVDEPMGRGPTPNAAMTALAAALAALGGYERYATPIKYQREDAWGR